MSRIYVCALSQIDDVSRSSGASHLLSVVSENTEVPRPASISPVNHLYLGFNDIVVPAAGLVAPGVDHIDRLLAFITGWDQTAPMLIHCWAGVSRSTAGVFIACCALNPQTDERAIAAELRLNSPKATPNARMVELADMALGRAGRMQSAIGEIGRGAYAYEGDLFSMPARWQSDDDLLVSGKP